MSELFNQTTASTADVNKRLAFGEPSQTGAFNILISNFFTQIKNYLLGTGNANTITSHAFSYVDVTYEYTASQYEFIEAIILKGIAAGETATVDYYTLNLLTGSYEANSIEMEDSNVLNINSYFDSSEIFERVIAISPSANCTIIIKSVKGL